MTDELTYFWLGLALILGLIFGSFANVLIHRLPREESIVKPGSHCPECSIPIPWHWNIPLASYIALKGKCRNCGAVIHFRYFLVELVTGLLFLAAMAEFGLSWESLFYAAVFFIMIVHAAIDLEHFLLLDSINIAGAIIGLAGIILIPSLDLIEGIFGAIFGGGLLGLVYLLSLAIFRKRGMGLGDIKTGAVMGLFLGVAPVIFTLLLASLLGIIWGVAKILTGQGRIVPFGTLLAIGAIAILLLDWFSGISGILY